MKKIFMSIAIVFLMYGQAEAGINDDLVAYYPFDGDATDFSGDNDGAEYGVSYTDGVTNQAVSFDGVNDYIQFGPSSALDNMTDELTIAFWMKTDDLTQGIPIVKRSFNPNNNDIHFAIVIHPNYGVSFQYSGAPGSPYPGYNAITTTQNQYPLLSNGEWHSILITHKYETRENTKIYIDGIMQDLTWQWDIGDLPAVVGDSILLMGKQVSSSPGYYDGLLDEVRFYNRVLSEAEIAILANANPPPSSDAGPDQTVDERNVVELDGSGSTGPQPLVYLWTQIAGPEVILDLTDPAKPTFTAPYILGNATLTFQLVVSSDSEQSEPDTVDVTVANVNNPPNADAGDDSTIKEGASYTLNGSNSYDPEGDPISYEWQQIGGFPVVELVPNNQIVNPSFVAPEGSVGQTMLFQLVVSDGKETSLPSTGADSTNADTVAITIVENSAPVADAGLDDTNDEGTVVTLDGSNSYDSDGGDTLSYQWTQTAGPTVQLNNAATATPFFTAPVVSSGGVDLEFTLTVTDDDPVNPKSSMDAVATHVRNINDPPSCDLAFPSDDSLWPPNHKMKEITIEGVMDEDSVYNTITLQIIGVTQDEPVNGQGDGDSSPDAVIQEGDPADSVLLRAERAGNGNGRVYAVNFDASDGFESCSGTVTVGVPHSRKDTAVDDGQLFDSTMQ